MQTIIQRNDGLTISINDNGKLHITKAGEKIDTATDEISSVEQLRASKSQTNAKLADAVEARGMTHLLGGRAALTADEAAAVISAINNHPENIARAEKTDKQLADLADYYKSNDNIARGYSRN